MTLRDIRDEVGSLGFDELTVELTALAGAVRRALSVMYAECGVKSVMRFYKRVPEKTVALGEITHPAGKAVTVGAGEGAYSLFVSGAGSFTLTDSDGTRRYSFNTGGKRFCGFIKGDGVFSFEGEGAYGVYNFFLYPDFYSERQSDVPTSSGCEEYSLKEIAPDYFAPLGAPLSPDKGQIKGARVYLDKIILPSDYHGEVMLDYRKAPPTVSADTPDEKIDIPRDREHLLPLLTAAYVWLDDDSEKAYYYMSLYREGMAALKLYCSHSVDASVGDVLGW